MDAANRPLHGLHHFIAVGAAAVDTAHIFLLLAHALYGGLRQRRQFLVAVKWNLFVNQRERLLGAGVQVIGPQRAGRLHRRAVRPHKAGHHGLFALADARGQGMQHAVCRFAGDQHDILGAGVVFQRVDTHQHTDAAHRLLQIAAPGADGL